MREKEKRKQAATRKNTSNFIQTLDKRRNLAIYYGTQGMPLPRYPRIYDNREIKHDFETSSTQHHARQL